MPSLPLFDFSVSDPSTHQLAGEIQALSDPVRMELIELVAMPKEHWTVAELAEMVSISPALASYHLRIAAKAGILESPQRGRFQITIAGEWWLAALDARRTLRMDLRVAMGLTTESPPAPQ